MQEKEYLYYLWNCKMDCVVIMEKRVALNEDMENCIQQVRTGNI